MRFLFFFSFQSSWIKNLVERIWSETINRDRDHKILIAFPAFRFWEAIQNLKSLPQSQVKEAAKKIFDEFLAPDAPCPVNVDSKSVELAKVALTNGPSFFCFDVAAEHIYLLMKNDSYPRYLRSDIYKDCLNGSKKKVKTIPNLFGKIPR